MAETIALPRADDTQTVYIRDASGNILQGQRKDLDAALKGGATEVSPQDVAKDKLQAKYGTIGHQVAAGAISAGNALTLGLGGGIAAGIGGEDVKNYIRDVEAANPLSSGLGTALGLVAPAILTGGGSLAEEGGSVLAKAAGRGAEALAYPTTALDEAGAMAGRAAEDLVGGGTVGRIAGGTARGALEGAVYGVNSQISEDIIQDKELTAERLLAGAGSGALLGGLLSGGLTGVGLGAEHALHQMAGATQGGLGDVIAKQAAQMQFRATGARTPEIRELRAHGMEEHEAGEWMLHQMPRFAEDGQAPLTREGILKATNAAVEDAGSRIGEHIDILDKAGFKPNYEPILDRLRGELVEPLSQKLGMKPVAERIDGLINQAKERLDANPTFRELHSLQQELDDLAWRDRKVFDQSNATKEIRNARAVIADEFKKQGEISLGPQWLKTYEDANHQFRMAVTVRRATEAADARISGNLGVSLSDKIIAAHGLTALAVGNPVGAVMSLGAAGLNHLVTHYGDAVASRLLDRLAHVSAIKDMSSAFGERTVEAVGKFLGTAHTGAVGGAVQLGRSFDRQRDVITKLSTNPDLLTAQLTPHLPEHAPKTSAIMAQRVAQAVAYLKSTMPATVTTGSVLTPQLGKKPSKLAQREWLQKVDVFENPLHVIKDMQKGMLTPAKADALKTMYPKLFEDIQQSIMAMVSSKAAKGHEPSYRARIQMGVLFGVPADATTQPAFVQSQQGLYAGGAPKEQPEHTMLTERAPAMAAKMKMGRAAEIGTEAQRLEENHVGT